MDPFQIVGVVLTHQNTLQVTHKLLKCKKIEREFYMEVGAY